MKKLLIAVLLSAGAVSFAQENSGSGTMREPRERLTPEQRNEGQLKKITTELNLNSAQQEQVKLFIAEKSAKAEKSREARKRNNTKFTSEQKEAFKKEMIAEKEANDVKMKEILTADQYAKWKANQLAERNKVRTKMKERRNN